MKKINVLTVAIGFLVLMMVVSSQADPVGKLIPYSKKTTLTFPKNYMFRFSLWDAETEGAEVWSEEKPIKLTTAKLTTTLGDTEPLDAVDFSQQYWVQVERKKGDGSFIAIGGRDRLTAVPYALHGGGGLGVYDGSGAFLGYFVEFGSTGYVVFNPSIPGVLTVESDIETPQFIARVAGRVWVLENCEGQSYTFYQNFGSRGLYHPQGAPASYFMVDTTLPILSGDEIKSQESGIGTCVPGDVFPGRPIFPLKQVDVPLMNQVLQNPIVLRPIQ